MSIIEQATQRLEQLRRAGIEVPPVGAPADRPGLVSAAMNAVERQAPAPVPAAPAAVVPPPAPAEIARRSREVVLDLDGLAARGYLTLEAGDRRLSEEFRALKRPLIDRIVMNDPPPDLPPANLIQVTSSLPGEGKTFCAINLALSIAMEVDRSVLLVDADVARPSLMARLGVEMPLGLLDVLTRPDLELSDVMVRTNVRKLSLLGAGTSMPKASELLASAAMDRLLADLSQRYPDRIVIFDAPPVLATSESRVLAAKMGQVVFVVEAGRTSQKEVVDGIKQLERCPVLLPMLNKSSEPHLVYEGY